MARTTLYGGRWKTGDGIGEGGQAHAFFASDNQREYVGQFVLKRLRKVEPRSLARFRREVEVIRSINHLNVVQIVDAGLDGPKPFYVMPYYPDGSIERLADRWNGSPAAALRFFASICDGVAAAHAKGVTHRDIKPGNILLTQDGEPVVADFGRLRADLHRNCGRAKSFCP